MKSWKEFRRTLVYNFIPEKSNPSVFLFLPLVSLQPGSHVRDGDRSLLSPRCHHDGPVHPHLPGLQEPSLQTQTGKEREEVRKKKEFHHFLFEINKIITDVVSTLLLSWGQTKVNAKLTKSASIMQT